ncbi:MAG: hypothetical protein AAF961_05265, partial [Planctomycetota bacterium]
LAAAGFAVDTSDELVEADVQLSVNSYDCLVLEAGVDERGRPRLAIVRADAKLCWYRSRSWQRPYPVFSKVDDFGFARPGPRRVEMPSGVFPVYRTEIRCRAVVPSIPPSIAPPERQLHRYHILWEAEWESIPVDPMLLRSLGKGIYTVLATWDLTPLERSVLRHSQIRD